MKQHHDKLKQVNSLSNLLWTSKPRVQVENLSKVVATKEMDGNP